MPSWTQKLEMQSLAIKKRRYYPSKTKKGENMKEKEKENAFLEASRGGKTNMNAREKALLWPILEALGVERRKWEKFKYHPDQLTGLTISCIKERNRKIANLERSLDSLQRQYAKVCQTFMNFKECPFGPKGKL